MKGLWHYFIATILAGWCAVGFGQDADAQLDERESSAVATINDVNAVAQTFARYNAAVEHQIHGARGVDQQSQQFFRQAYEFIQRLYQGLALIDLADSHSFARIITETTAFLRQRHGDLNRLAADSQMLQQRASRGLHHLSIAKSLPQANNERIAQVGEAVHRSIATAEEVFRQAQTGVDERMAELQRLLNLSGQAMRAKLRAQIIRTGLVPLEQSLARYDRLLAFERDIRPFIIELEAAELHLETQVLDLAYAQGQEAFAHAQNLCDARAERMSHAEVDEGDLATAVDRIESICTAVAGHWQALNQTGLTRAQLAEEYRLAMAPAYARECQKVQPQINCEQFAVLQAISAETLDQMTHAELSFFERSWARLGEGL